MLTTAALPRSGPRCLGRLFHTRDAYGGSSACLACGFVHAWVADPAIALPAARAGRRKREPSCNGLRL